MASYLAHWWWVITVGMVNKQDINRTHRASWQHFRDISLETQRLHWIFSSYQSEHLKGTKINSECPFKKTVVDIPESTWIRIKHIQNVYQNDVVIKDGL